jgi:hypothetical protein
MHTLLPPLCALYFDSDKIDRYGQFAILGRLIRLVAFRSFSNGELDRILRIPKTVADVER